MTNPKTQFVFAGVHTGDAITWTSDTLALVIATHGDCSCVSGDKSREQLLLLTQRGPVWSVASGWNPIPRLHMKTRGPKCPTVAGVDRRR